MNILHTSDWHLGRSLYGRKRYEEHEAFLDWLLQTIESKNIDILLVAGDIFDTSTPSNRAQELYYRFLCQAAASSCRHVVIIAGNHDSPSFLNAPKELLKALNVQVVGATGEDLQDEVLLLGEPDAPEAIICAVPYLRDRDLRTATPGQTQDDKNVQMLQGLQAHYAAVCDLARQKQALLAAQGHAKVPILATGHLFTAGGQTVEQDGVRDLYVGSLMQVGADVFPEAIDYLALGHLHVPQTIGNDDTRRYSGSPLPMGFGEAKQEKSVLHVAFSGQTPEVRKIKVPCFQPLERIRGELSAIEERIAALAQKGSRAWLEIEYTGKEAASFVRERLEEATQSSDLEIRRIRNQKVIEQALHGAKEEETLGDLDVDDVFSRCLDAYDIPQEQRETLRLLYKESIQTMQEADRLAQ